ncbi:MAG: zinc ribbon domain-containing protein [Candidatus Aminicenantes bacterium]|nr:MAG: zinc ribbon domain-containing protein [Candidatus Aminicenantes bacterium]
MDRKKIIVRLAVAAIVVFLLASYGRIWEFIHKTSIKTQLTSQRNEQLTELAKNYQKYLDETAAKITQLPVSQHTINQITSDFLKKSPITKLYLWMSDPEGKFIFGVPYPVFERLNKSYDKYANVIEADGYYVDRNDFLFKLVHRHDDIRLSQFEAGSIKIGSDTHRRLMDGRLPMPGTLRWRFYRESSDFQDYSDPLRLELSAPVVDDNQQMIGTLCLKIDDYTTQTKSRYLRRKDFLNGILFPACEGFFAVSLVFLWFLLPSWVYIDARQRDVKNAVRWALLTVISVGFAWLIYLLVRPSALKSFYCPQCKKELNGTKAYCPFCGFDLSEVFCPQCQYPVKPGWQFCPNCRTDLSQEPQPQEEIPEEKSK